MIPPKDWSPAEKLAAWLNRKQPGLEEAQGEVARAIELLRTKGRGPSSLEKPVLVKFSRIAVRWEGWWDQFGYVVAPIVTPQTEVEYGLCLLSDVTKAHLFDTVRQCRRCKRWFVARTFKKVFCSADCQSDYWFEYRKTPQGLKEMREHRRRWRVQQRKSKGGKKR